MVQTANTIWRDFVTDGIPASGAWDPRKVDIREWCTWVEAGLKSGALNGPWKANLADLNADLAYDADTVGFVYDTADIGTYVKSGASGSGSWTKILDFIPGYQIAEATDDGNSTANAYTMNTSPHASSSDGVTLIHGSFPVTNTSETVTITLDGGTALAVKTAAGNNPSVGGLLQGMPFIGKISGSGTTFRLLSDQASAAIVAAAEAAQAYSELWAQSPDPIPEEAGGDGANDRSSKWWATVASGAMTTVIDPQFSTKATAESYSPDVAPDYIRTAGYYAAGDGGEALYKKVSAEPKHEGKFSITLSDGVNVVWYELAALIPNVLQFGAKVNDFSFDSHDAIQNAINFASVKGMAVELAPGFYRVNDTLEVNDGPLRMFCRNNIHWNARKYNIGAGAVIVFRGTTGEPALDYLDKENQYGQVAGHSIDGVSFVGGHIRYGDYNNFCQPRRVGVASQSYSWRVCGVFEGELSDFTAITDGSIRMTVDGSDTEVTGLDFSAATSIQEVTDILFNAAWRCTFAHGRFIFEAGTTAVSVSDAPSEGTSLHSLLKLDDADGAVSLDGQKLCTKGMDLTQHNFNSTIEECAFWNINGENIWIADPSGFTKVKACHFLNDQDVVTTTPNSMIRVESGSTSIEIIECDFEMQNCDNAIRIDGADHLTIERNHFELPATATCKRMIALGSTNPVKSGVIAKNFANSKGNADEFISVTNTDGVSIHDNDIRNFKNSLVVSATEGAIVGHLSYYDNRVQGLTGNEIIGSAHLVDTHGQIWLSWTPVYQPASGSFGAITYDSNRGGRYTRHGNMITVAGWIGTDSITVGTASGNVTIGGLPVDRAAHVSGLDMSAAGAVGDVSGFTTAPIGITFNPSNIGLKKRSSITGDTSGLQVTDLDTGANKNFLAFSGSYPCVVNA